jgi:hypothetical protein
MRRKRFRDMADKLVAGGCAADTARNELLKFMCGQPNEQMNLAKRMGAENK